MKLLVVLGLLSVGASAFANPQVCSSGKSPYVVNISGDARSGAVSVSNSGSGLTLVAKLACHPVKPQIVGNDIPYTFLSCDDTSGNKSGFGVALTTGGFAGMTVAKLYKNVSFIGSLPCSEPK